MCWQGRLSQRSLRDARKPLYFLEETLKEEKAADRKLTELYKNINEQDNEDAQSPSDEPRVRGKRGVKRAA